MLKQTSKILSLIFLFALLTSCSNAGQPTSQAITETPTLPAVVELTPEATSISIWDSLVSHFPIPYGTPLPPAVAGPIDGLYGRLLDVPPQWWRCLRCADYRPSGGLWRLQFDKGVMRIYYTITDWRAIASFRVEGDRLFIFNDSTCIQSGEYIWHLEGGSLTLEPVSDGCYFDLRAENLSATSWDLCPADRNEAGAPLGCGDRANFEPLVAADLPVTVTVREGNARTYDPPLDLIVRANKEDRPAPEGVEINHAPQSMPYGVNRVLWWGGDWIEATTSLPYESMGVQFYGSSSIGWASVFFDGTEVWRGDVAAIWDHFGSYGGYIEVNGYEPGEHTLRVELVEGDYRPLTIAVFGFNSN